MTKSELEFELSRVRDTLKFALEMQQGVEDFRPHYEGSPANTVTWMELATTVLNDD